MHACVSNMDIISVNHRGYLNQVSRNVSVCVCACVCVRVCVCMRVFRNGGGVKCWKSGSGSTRNYKQTEHVLHQNTCSLVLLI